MEIWEKIKHLDLVDFVEVSNFGNVRKIFEDKIHYYSTSPNSRGYINIRLNHYDGNRYNHTVHRLVAITFLGYYDKLVINHIDGNRLNNRIENLEWVTRQQNCQHSKGIIKFKRCKDFYDEELLTIINEYLENIIPLNELCVKLNVTRETLRTLFNVRALKILTEEQYNKLRLASKKNSNYGKNI